MEWNDKIGLKKNKNKNNKNTKLLFNKANTQNV